MLSNYTLHRHNSQFGIYLAGANSNYKSGPPSPVQLELNHKEKPPACKLFARNVFREGIIFALTI